MNKKYDLNKILEQLKEDENRKSDELAKVGDLRIDPFSGKLMHGNEPLTMSNWATQQLCSKIGIPPNYYQKCDNNLRAANANKWLKDPKWQEKSVVMRVRNDGEKLVRGFVTSKYTPFEDHEVIEATLKFLNQHEYDVLRWRHSDRGFHLRVAMKDAFPIGTTLDGKPDTHRIGLHIENSEVGGRSIRITPMVYRLVCTNGLMIWKKDGEVYSQRHMFSSRTEVYENLIVALGTKLHENESTIQMLKSAKEHLVEQPLKLIEDLGKQFNLTQKMIFQIQASYNAEPGNNLFYIIQAITDAAKQEEEDKRVDLETVAGSILTKLTA